MKSLSDIYRELAICRGTILSRENTIRGLKQQIIDKDNLIDSLEAENGRLNKKIFDRENSILFEVAKRPTF